MNQKPLKVLEFHKIVDMLTAHSTCEPGRALASAITPLTDIYEINTLQRETAAALSRLLKKGSVSFGGVRDLSLPLKRLDIGSTLNQTELMNVASLLENAGRAKAYGKRDNGDTESDCLDVRFARLDPCHVLSEKIRSCILSEDEISDNASPELSRIRRLLRSYSGKIHNELNSLLNGSYRTYLQDAVITMRDGRYCIPVKNEYRSVVPGMIHDQSSSGATVFIEPASIIKMNNEIKELMLDEEKEIAAILADLSSRTYEHSNEIKQDQDILTELDFIFARGRLALDMNAFRPDFNEDGIIDLKKARHPLISKDTVVPIDIRLGEDFTLLVITGPNTGGKTVALKTTGLLTLMGQAGLHIPAAEGSKLSIFSKVFADIGDEQSIEQSLSTFSSHMKNVVTFIKKADRNSLVLFDELGAGTDPTEGAALAIAILSNLHQKDIRTIATTHYSELKLFAMSTDGVENACCEFNVETLRPTYHLLIGVPGKSNAFAISRRLGLPQYIIDAAKTQIDENDIAFEDLITDLETNKRALEAEKQRVETLRSESDAMKAQLESQRDKLTEKKEKLLRDANEEAYNVLREAKEFADKAINAIRKRGGSSEDIKELEKLRSSLRERLDDAASKKTAKPAASKNFGKLDAASVRIGDTVRVISMNVNGTVTSLPDKKGDLFVQTGILKSKVNITNLEPVEDYDPAKAFKEKKGGGSSVSYSKAMNITSEINLLGKTVDEALAELDKYLDDAYLAHLKSVRIVHGKGTGALRRGVHAYLRSHPNIKSFKLAEFGEGDAGVTIVNFN